MEILELISLERKGRIGYQGYRDLIIYQKLYQAALQIFELTKNFPK